MIRIRTGTHRLGGETVILHEQVENGHIVGQICRKPLPNRRPGETVTLHYNGQNYHLTLGFDPISGSVAEVFICGAKAGSEMDSFLDSACILLSKLYQAGADPIEISETLGNQCVLGAVAAVVAAET